MSSVLKMHCERLRPMLENMIMTTTKIPKPDGSFICKKSFVTKKFDAFKRGYFLVGKDEKADPKLLEKENDMLVRELEVALDAIKAGLGNRPIRIQSAMDFGLTATVTSGVVNTVTCGTQTTGVIRMEDIHDWASLAALFDEVKPIGGVVHFIYNNLSKAVGTAVDANSIPLITWQPVQATLSGVVAAASNAQHKFLGIAPTNPTVPTNHFFRFYLPQGDGTMTGAQISAGFKEWYLVQEVASDNVYMGSIGFIHVGTVATATKIGAGVLLAELEFRMRI